ncbi:hypothetical protein QE152_g35894 [Popillia japonica]|uniref:Uncharacterized protein n=1 Tax=Popillia japonica TaxID=7064 RepID=A0AAW1IEI9_POPJA
MATYKQENRRPLTERELELKAENIWVNDNNDDEVEDVFGDDSDNDEDYVQGQVSDTESEQSENDGENEEHEPVRNISSLRGKNDHC